MAVPANTLTRVTAVATLFNSRMQTSIFVSNLNDLSDSQWRSQSYSCFANWWAMVTVALSHDVILQQIVSNVLGPATPRPSVVGVGNVPGNFNGPALSRMHYACFNYNGPSKNGLKQFRRTQRVFGIPLTYIERGMMSQDYLQDIETAMRGWYGTNSTVGGATLPTPWAFVIPHLNKAVTPNIWEWGPVRNFSIGGIPKTLGSREYVN